MENNFYISKEQFAALTAAWKSSKAHRPSEHIIYNILRSKPADLGFVAKTKHIQGNNPWPWNAFNNALFDAGWSITYRKFGGELRSAERYEEQKRMFKIQYGIDLPVDLLDKMKGLQK